MPEINGAVPPAVGDKSAVEVFVASPIGSPGSEGYRRSRLVLDYIVRKALAPPQWDVVRADDELSPDSITQRVIGRILKSAVIIVDLTDHNPNVFYELAIAHCYRKPVVQIASEGTSVPFDVTDQRTIFYDLADPSSVDAAKGKLLSAAEYALTNSQDLVTPLTTLDQLTKVSERIEAGDVGEMATVLAQILGRLDQMERGLQVRDDTRAREFLKFDPLQRSQELTNILQVHAKLTTDRLRLMEQIEEARDRLYSAKKPLSDLEQKQYERHLESLRRKLDQCTYQLDELGARAAGEYGVRP